MVWWGKRRMGLLWLMFTHQGHAGQPGPIRLGYPEGPARAAAEITVVRHVCLEKGGGGEQKPPRFVSLLLSRPLPLVF